MARRRLRAARASACHHRTNWKRRASKAGSSRRPRRNWQSEGVNAIPPPTGAQGKEILRGDSTEAFVYQALPIRVVFGSGTLATLGQEVERLGARRALVLSTPGRGEALAEMVARLLGDRSAGVHPGAVMHTPLGAT